MLLRPKSLFAAQLQGDFHGQVMTVLSAKQTALWHHAFPLLVLVIAKYRTFVQIDLVSLL
ncbi:hypothetical protein EDM56_09315 [Brevibacillus fluminis]|uniref:Uncharacterized protein n=1 Tax=Brevibacillus fluminis TaxID=511487 RepID=A0A3M8DTJ7_9BACL|nr:hypothetical protein EDM56_09315 [Brevibacillus fluminis]